MLDSHFVFVLHFGGTLVEISSGDAHLGGACGYWRHCVPAGTRPSGLHLFLPGCGAGELELRVCRALRFKCI